MGGASSGGSDNDVSGAEAVATGGTTYSSRKTKTVNKQIAATNQKNRDDRRSPIAKILSKTPGGIIMGKIKNSKFVQDSNYNRRLKFAQKSGKFKDTPLTREFVLSDGFKNQLDGMGYSDQPGNVGGNDNRDDNNNQTTLEASAQVLPVNNVTAPSNAEITQAQSTTMSGDEILLANKKKGRSETILKSAQGLGDSTLQTTKKKLGA